MSLMKQYHLLLQRKIENIVIDKDISMNGTGTTMFGYIVSERSNNLDIQTPVSIPFEESINKISADTVIYIYFNSIQFNLNLG